MHTHAHTYIVSCRHFLIVIKNINRLSAGEVLVLLAPRDDASAVVAAATGAGKADSGTSLSTIFGFDAFCRNCSRIQ
jgi:hypothetical protein